jgi:hypothetical protein
MSIPKVAQPALRSIKALAKTKKNTPEAKVAARVVRKRLRTLRRSSSTWYMVLGGMLIGGATAAAVYKYGNQVGITVPQSLSTQVAAARASGGRLLAATTSGAKALLTKARSSKNSASATWGAAAGYASRGLSKVGSRIGSIFRR